MFLTLLWSELTRIFSLLSNTFMTLNPKIGLSSGSLITKKVTYNSPDVLPDSSDNSNFNQLTQGMVSLYIYPNELVDCRMDLTVPKLLASVNFFTSHFCDSKDNSCIIHFACYATFFHQLTEQIDLVLMEKGLHCKCLFCTHLLSWHLLTELLYHRYFVLFPPF